jgi:hypothetical protein
MDSTAQTAPAALEFFNENASTSDEWIPQRKQPLGLQKSSTKLLQGVTHAIDSANSPCGLRNHQRNRVTGDSKIINETASTVTHGFDSANNPCGFRNHQRNCFHG